MIKIKMLTDDNEKISFGDFQTRAIGISVKKALTEIPVKRRKK